MIIIIIEGPDNVGKSTLIKNIRQKLQDDVFHVLHSTPIKLNSVNEYIDYSTKQVTSMFELMRFTNENLIFDRSHLGELIYGNIYRGYTGDFVIDIEKTYADYAFFNHVYLITLIDTAENLIKREDGLSFSIDPDVKNRELKLFEYAHNKSLIKNKLLINVRDYNESALLNLVLPFIKAGV